MDTVPVDGQRFCKDLVLLNALDKKGFSHWIFHPGMLFGSGRTWWGTGGMRSTPHEGVDFCRYATDADAVESITAGTRVPALFSGRIMRIHTDYIGHSVYLQHEITGQKGQVLYSVYGHVVPGRNAKQGGAVRQGDVFAVVADASLRKAPMASHLHVSVAWVSPGVAASRLSWDTLNDPRVARLVDPLDLLVPPCRIIEHNPQSG